MLGDLFLPRIFEVLRDIKEYLVSNNKELPSPYLKVSQTCYILLY